MSPSGAITIAIAPDGDYLRTPDAAESSRSASSRQRMFGAALAIALVTIAVLHVPSLGFGFLEWDDNIHVTKNAAVLAPSSVPIRDQLTTPTLGYPIPITVATYTLEASILGLAPWHFHLINVLLHVASCALVFLIALRLRLTLLGAACATLLFGLHPVVAEPVSWVTGRKDLLATCFGLGMLILAWPPRSRARNVAALACYAAGLLSKPTIAPLCVFVPVIDALFGEPDLVDTSAPWATWTRSRVLAAWRVLWPYFIVLVPVMILGVVGQHAAGALSDPDHAGASFTRAAWYALGHHLRLLFGLEEPTAKYLPLPWPPGFTPGVDLMPLLAAALAALALRKLPEPQRTTFAFGLAWAVLTYLPSSNLIPLVRYLADSYVYLPLIGAAFCGGALADWLVQRFERLSPFLRYALPLLVLAICTPAFVRSQQRFTDDQTLWGHALTRYPYNARLCRMWANGVAKQRGPKAGLDATDRCMGAFGDELFAKNKGVLLGLLGRFDEARTWLERARELRPSDASVRAALANLPAAKSGTN